MSDYAIDTASRFGDIPFTEFTQELITGVFDSLVDAHILQMDEYATFLNSLTNDLSTYINNTVDGVSFDQVADFIENFELPQISESELNAIMENLANPAGSASASPTSATTETWWGGLINALGPVVNNLVDKIPDPNQFEQLQAIQDYNAGVLSALPSYQQVYDSIAALIASNKYSLLQNMAKQGLLRLVVTEGEVETKVTFSTWNNTSSGRDYSYKQRRREKSKRKRGGGIIGIFQSKRKRKTRIVTINTAKSYQRDSSGTSANIFGKVLIRFKSDYAPLNG
ncbi:MAG: hypothetical protein AAFQ94_28025 [Bacteroidota bacterium]